MKKIWEKLKRPKYHGFSIYITWCPGHCDILCNEMADDIAKKSAESLSQTQPIPSSESTLDFSALKVIIKNQQTKAW